jgi:hypothetical protein
MEEAKLQSELLPVIQKAQQLKITTNDEYKEAGEFLKFIKGRQKKIDGEFDPGISAAFLTHRTLTTQKKKFAIPYAEAETCVKKEMGRFSLEQENKRREEQLRLEAELKEKQEAEALKAAEMAEQAGNQEEAREILQDAINNAPTVIVENTTRAEGISTRKTWKWKLIDKNQVDPIFLIVDTKQVDQIVRAMGKNAEFEVKGILCYEETIISSRSM